MWPGKSLILIPAPRSCGTMNTSAHTLWLSRFSREFSFLFHSQDNRSHSVWTENFQPHSPPDTGPCRKTFWYNTFPKAPLQLAFCTAVYFNESHFGLMMFSYLFSSIHTLPASQSLWTRCLPMSTRYQLGTWLYSLGTNSFKVEPVCKKSVGHAVSAEIGSYKTWATTLLLKPLVSDNGEQPGKAKMA